MDNIRTCTRLAIGRAAEIGGEQTGMYECCAERVQPSDRGRVRAEQNRIGVSVGERSPYDDTFLGSFECSFVSFRYLQQNACTCYPITCFFLFHRIISLVL